MKQVVWFILAMLWGATAVAGLGTMGYGPPPVGGPGATGKVLAEDASFILQEDGVGMLCLESGC